LISSDGIPLKNSAERRIKEQNTERIEEWKLHIILLNRRKCHDRK
jgi:hypothetical protein